MLAFSFQEVLIMFKFGHPVLSAPVFADGKNTEEQSHISTSGITQGDQRQWHRKCSLCSLACV